MMSSRQGRARGVAMVEYVILMVFILITGLPVVLTFARTIRCKMTESPGHPAQCGGTASVRLTTSDDGCIGLVCKQGVK